MARSRAALLSGAALAATLLFAVPGIGRADPALDQALRNPADWPMYRRTYSNQHYSPLKQINAGNVGHLKPAWAFQVGALEARLRRS